ERQKRLTVGSLTLAAWASAAMLKRVACCGLARMTSATLRSALFSSSRRPWICSRRFRTRSMGVCPWVGEAAGCHGQTAFYAVAYRTDGTVGAPLDSVYTAICC